MIYELGSRGLKPVGVHANEKKNSLLVGTVLHLNGYDYHDSIIIKNFGISEKFPDYGTKYLVVSLADYGQSQRNAFELKHISEKQDGRIQTYITDKIVDPDAVLEIWEKSEAKRKRMAEAQVRAKKEADELEAKGRELFKKHIPENAQALIVACYNENESDVQTDYFAHKTTKTVILGYSLHKRDLFSEMRKHAGKIPETVHLGTGKGHFESRVVIGEDINSNGSYYNKGQYSHWHRELTEKDGRQVVFVTLKEAEEYVNKIGKPGSINFDGKEVGFEWSIEEKKIEHREKWSMGSGYYLKDGGSHRTGWRVEKVKKYGESWGRDLYISMGRRCVF